MNVADKFKEFQKAKLMVAKKSDIEYMKEVYADTELFDITQREHKPRDINLVFSELANYELPDKQFLLPFENCFFNVLNVITELTELESEVFIREYSADTLTGCIVCHHIPIDSRYITLFAISVPFTIKINTKVVCCFDVETIKKSLDKFRDTFTFAFKKVNKNKYPSLDKMEEQCNQEFIAYCIDCIGGFLLSIVKVQETINALSKNVILTDYSNSVEHYHFKSKPTKKVTNRPIYYVLNKEKYQKKNYTITPITRLDYSHAFKVIGHWRRIDGIGKDRKGSYHVDGFTWVNEYIKGEGELVKRIRVVK